MPINEALASRIRSEIGEQPGLAEQKMFGGLAFLINGNMACGASKNGLMVRFDPKTHDETAKEPGATPFVMRGKEMKGWLFVGYEAIDDGAFNRWVARGVEYAKSLPPK